MSNVVAGIGRGQMKVIDERVKQKRNIYNFYFKELSEVEGISFLPEPESHFSNRWLTTIIVDSSRTNSITSNDIRLALEEENIESRLLWKPMHLQPVFKDAPAYINGVSEELFDTGLCLPSGTELTEEQLHKIVTTIKNSIHEMALAGG